MHWYLVLMLPNLPVSLYRPAYLLFDSLPLFQLWKGFRVFIQTISLFQNQRRGNDPILDLKALYLLIPSPKFCRFVITSLYQGDLPASVDIKDAYVHVPIFPAHQHNLRLVVSTQHYQFVAIWLIFCTSSVDQSISTRVDPNTG